MENNLSDYLLPLVKKYWLVLFLALCALIFFAYGMISFIGARNNSSQVNFDENLSSVKATVQVNLFAVDIEGQVRSPGVYKLKQNSIVQDVLVASGGLNAIADRDWVAKNLNLALKITDGQKIYIPRIGETNIQASSPNSQVLGSTLATNLININLASETDLDSLPGIGPVTAAKIINNRPYSNINELLNKKVVSQKVFDEIKDKIIAQ
jgi:competence protein ComEA